MSRIKSHNTKPELIVRKWLWSNGYRYRLYGKNLPGKPDIILKKYNVVIFVHGCFWHRHGCKYSTFPATRSEFWEQKFKENIERDSKVVEKLKMLGWRILIIWECEIKNWNTELEQQIKKILI